MTQEKEEELTRQAMERAKSPLKAPAAETKTKEPKATKPKATKELKETPKETKLLDNQRKLGQRIVTLKAWSGKTKKKFKKEFEYVESMEDLDLQKIIEILVYDQIEEDYQLTELELQYLLTELKEISLGSKIECEVRCPECTEPNIIKSDTKDAVYFKADTLPAKFKDWDFKNIKRSEFLKTKKAIQEADDFDGLSTDTDIELACKISKGVSPKEMLEVIDDTGLLELTEVMENYVSHLAEFTITAKHKCKGCQSEETFNLDIITGIFEALAK